MNNNLERDLALAYKVAGLVDAAGGRTYFVGGYVRDRLLGEPATDVDIEVYGIGEARLLELLATIGVPQRYGSSYEIYSLAGSEIDITIPHTKAPDGTRVADPSLSTYEAALRRDLTIDALMQDVLTGEIIDHFGGRLDLQHKVLRHVSAVSFAEDPLRVFRVASHAARLNMRPDSSTLALARSLDTSGVSPERVAKELEKALTKARRPSQFFLLLDEMDALSYWFAELGRLIGVEQNPIYHPEGDAFVHTMAVIDAAACFIGEVDQPFAFMLSALCHDLGKALTTCVREGKITSWGHEEAGIKPTRALLNRLKVSNDTKAYVVNMVKLHMRPGMLVHHRASDKAFRRCFKLSVNPHDLIALCLADRMGTGSKTDNAYVAKTLCDQLDAFNTIMERPAVQGRDLIALGAKPGPLIGETLRYAEKLQLAGIDNDRALKHCMSYYRELEAAARKGER